MMIHGQTKSTLERTMTMPPKIFNDWKLNFATLIICLSVFSCRQAVVAFGGGIVDNGDKPTDSNGGTPTSDGQHPHSLPSDGVMADTPLFNGRHTIGLPKAYEKSSPSATHDIFSMSDRSVIEFRLVDAACSGTATRVTTLGATLITCQANGSLNVWDIEATNGDIVHVVSSLDADILDPIFDTFKTP